MGKNHVKCLHYSFEVYCEHFSVKELDTILARSLVPCIRSPAHCRDDYSDLDLKRYIDNHDGEVPSWSVGDRKKPHWHIIFQCPYPKSPKACLSYIQNMMPLLDIVYVVPVMMLNLSCRYLCHLDEVNKTKYNTTDCKNFNGFMADFHKPEPFKNPVQVLDIILSSISTMAKPSLTSLLSTYRNDEQIIKYIQGHTSLVCRLIDERKGLYDL